MNKLHQHQMEKMGEVVDGLVVLVKVILFLAIIFFLFFIQTASASAVWFSSSWTYKVAVEVNPNKVGTPTAITSFPVYLDLAGMPASFWTNASNTGADIRVVESDDTTETAFELVSFATTTQRGELHFMADTLATTSSSTFYIYYGNAAAQAYAVGDTYGRNAVWTGYAAVYHHNNLTTDYSGNSRTLTNTNSVVTDSTGNIGTAADFGTTNTNKQLNYGTAILPASLTISSWVRLNTEITSGTYGIFSHHDNTTVLRNFQLTYNYNAGSQNLVADYHKNNTSDNNVTWSSGALGTTNWTKVTLTSDGTFRFYGNGTTRGTPLTISGGGSGTVGTAGIHLGLANRYSAYGPVDLSETRFKTSAVSASWELTEYNNQSSTSTFFYIGPEQTNATGTPATSTDTGIIWFD